MPTELNPVTADRVKAVCPNAGGDIIEAIVTGAPRALPAAGLNDPVRISHFISHFVAQIATETGGLRRLDENLNSTTVKRLRDIFSSKFRTDNSAKGYIRNAEKLADFVYAGRNGNSKPDDGWKYRGSGLIKSLGEKTFDRIGRLVGLDLVDDPELARKPDSALEIALGYWTKHDINSVAGDASEDAVKKVTKLINPKQVGLAEREGYFGTESEAGLSPRPRRRPPGRIPTCPVRNGSNASPQAGTSAT
jgi:predicted chitinase